MNIHSSRLVITILIFTYLVLTALLVFFSWIFGYPASFDAVEFLFYYIGFTGGIVIKQLVFFLFAFILLKERKPLPVLVKFLLFRIVITILYMLFLFFSSLFTPDHYIVKVIVFSISIIMLFLVLKYNSSYPVPDILRFVFSYHIIVFVIHVFILGTSGSVFVF